MSAHRPSPITHGLRATRAGFALLIVITLLAFVIVLLVGLSVYTRVETAVAGNTQRQEQARANALLGLNVAVGQLQKYAGPDQRVTAAADAFGGHTGTSHYTGVWSSNPADSAGTGPTPLTWLVSGNEALQPDGTPANPVAVDPISTVTTTNGVALVSANTTRTNDVLARLMPITANGVPGTAPTANPTVGRYAWWVGDQGVKAPVAVPDASSSVSYAPFVFTNAAGGNSTDLRTRIRQQISLGAGAVDATKTPLSIVFEPRDGNTSSLVSNLKVVAPNQLAFLKAATQDGSAAASTAAIVGPAIVRQNFHAWAPNNFAVLANTKLGGLRQDLSLQPNLLGDAFAKWSDFTDTTYMEDPGNPATPAPSPAYGSDPLRRRYFLHSPATNGNAIFSVAPALSFFGMSFSVRESSAAPQMEVAARCVIGLWNPYSAALVPEDLKVEVTGLPDIQVVDNAGGTSPPFSLQAVMAGGDTSPLQFSLPIPTTGGAADKSSWLPGRVYDWSAVGNALAPSDVNIMVAHHPSATGAGGLSEGIVRPTSIAHGVGPTTPAGSELTRSCLSFGETTLHIRLLRASDGSELAAYDSLPFDVFGNGSGTTPMRVDLKYVDFAFVFRLPETNELPTASTEKWLSASGRDPRSNAFPGGGFIGGPKGEDPAAYGGSDTSAITGFAVGDQNRLLDRETGGESYDEDVPVFELPRAPILSLGELQHLQLAGQRPFAIGNSWGAATQLNGVNVSELFDRYYFSGLANGVTPTVDSSGNWVSPNPLQVHPRKSDGTRPSPSDLTAAPNAMSSKFTLQGGAFNLNSASAAAWAAVLRSVRFPNPQSFSYANESFSTGTSTGDGSKLTVQSADAQFFRFAQSAQETYEADDPAQATDATGAATTSTYAASTAAPPDPPNPISTANTQLFRRGMKTLTAAQVGTLATNIANAVKAHQAANGPFRSLEEFLAPISGGPSLIEQAIVDADAAGAQINTDGAGTAIEFSSQYLTQADIMTALAPVLFPRSDTFIVRAYGEAVNPTTGVTEGKAWCEATVQRVPDYFDPTDPAETAPADFSNVVDPTDPNSQPSPAHQLNNLYGRRFKIVAFRWLTRSDI